MYYSHFFSSLFLLSVFYSLGGGDSEIFVLIEFKLTTASYYDSVYFKSCQTIDLQDNRENLLLSVRNNCKLDD